MYVCTSIHEPEANNCFSIITQVIIEIPKQRNVTILPQLAIVDKSLYHAAHVNVSGNTFLNLRLKKKTFSLTFIPGKNKPKCGFAVCTLIDNGYASLFFSQTMFSYCFCMLSEFAKVLERKTDLYKQLICIKQRVHFQVAGLKVYFWLWEYLCDQV